MKYPGKHHNYWVSLSDIMTGLMVIFMFISISYMIQVKNEQKKVEKFVTEYVQTKLDLYKELKTEFEDDFKPDKWNVILDKDLSIKFLNESVLFDYNKAELKDEFKILLLDFFPRYLKVFLKKNIEIKLLKFRSEGHSDPQGDYFYNVDLSIKKELKMC